jgi:hypothetical protein
MKLAKLITVAVLGMAFVVVIAEASFKLFSACELSAIIHDEQLGWRLKKSYRWHHNNPEALDPTGTVTTNSSGLRDREHARVKDPGRKRVLFLGDSYTAALEYSDDEIFTQLFEQKLQDSMDRVETLQAAVPAWATDQQYLYLKNEGLQFSPDYVILMTAPNDIRETYSQKLVYPMMAQVVEHPPVAISWKTRLSWFLANNSCGFQFWQKHSHNAYGGFADILPRYRSSFPIGLEMVNDKHLFLREVPAQILKARELYKTLLLGIKRLCESSHCKLLTTVIPTKMEYDGTLKEPQYQAGLIADYVEEIAAENNVPFLNLLRPLNKEANPLKIFISGEYHLSRYGHEFLTTQLLPFFLANQ